MTVSIFIHGLDSGNQGTKSVFFREKYPDMIIPNFIGDLQERMEKLQRIISGKSNIRLVGSSFGGLMSTLFAMENESLVDKMVLLAPAINLLEYASKKELKISLPVWIYHGKKDEVIPISDVETVAKRIFTDLSFQAVDDDHYLHNTFKSIEWDDLLA